MKITVSTLRSLKENGRKAVFITAYDYPTAVFAERAGVDMILIGDSAAMTTLGHPTTLGVGMREMLTLAAAVCRGVKPRGRAFVIGDLPFLSYQTSDSAAVRNAGRFVRVGCDAVKCEGGRRVAGRVRAMTDAGINVMGHLGLTPQNLAQLSGYRVQGKTLAACNELAEDARALQEAGAFAILLEALPAEAAAYVRDAVSIPVYGIGAGPLLDGQLVISNDILGNFVGDIAPRFVRRYANVGEGVERAFAEYARDVRELRFPAEEHCYPLDADSVAELRRARDARLAGDKPTSEGKARAVSSADAPTAAGSDAAHRASPRTTNPQHSLTGGAI